VCSAIDTKETDWATFDLIMDTLEDPKDHMKQVEENIIMNGMDITKDIESSIQSLNSGDYENFGFSLGETMALATQKSYFLY
jgi:hypothetical protein